MLLSLFFLAMMQGTTPPSLPPVNPGDYIQTMRVPSAWCPAQLILVDMTGITNADPLGIDLLYRMRSQVTA